MTKTCDAFVEVYFLRDRPGCAMYRFVPVGTTVAAFNRDPDYMFGICVKDVKVLRLDYPSFWYIGCWPKPPGLGL